MSQHWTDSDDPRRIRRGLFGALVIWTVAFLVLFSAIGVVGWRVGWWFKEENVKRQVVIDNSNKGTQTAWHDEAINAINDYDLVDPSNTAVRGNLHNKACMLIARLNDPYRDAIVIRFEAKECK